jgi:uracil-DNA glycosylase family 4
MDILSVKQVLDQQAFESRLKNLDNIKYGILHCLGCSLRGEAIGPVVFEGNPTSKILIISRYPTEQEDVESRPLVDKAGRYLFEFLASLGVDRSRLMVTHVAKCHPLCNRPPLEGEYKICLKRHLLLELLELKPKIAVALGRDTLKIMTYQDRIKNHRQKFHAMKTLDLKVVGIIHPNSAVAASCFRKQFIEDWKWLVETPEWKEAYRLSDPDLKII